MRDLLHRSSSAFVLVLIMFSGSLLLWVGIPLAWLWIGSQVQAVTESIGAALATMFVGVIASIILAVPALSWLSNRYRAIRVARGLEDTGHFALETVLVLSAGLAVVSFGLWFLVFAGSSPIPLNIQF